MLKGDSNLLPPHPTASSFAFYPRSTNTRHLGRHQLHACRSESFSSSTGSATSIKRPPTPRLLTGNAITGPNESSRCKTFPPAAGEPRPKPQGRAKVTDSRLQPTPGRAPPVRAYEGRPSGPGPPLPPAADRHRGGGLNTGCRPGPARGAVGQGLPRPPPAPSAFQAVKARVKQPEPPAAGGRTTPSPPPAVPYLPMTRGRTEAPLPAALPPPRTPNSSGGTARRHPETLLRTTNQERACRARQRRPPPPR